MSEMPRYTPGPAAYEPPQVPVAPPVMNTIFYLLLGAAFFGIIAAIFGVIDASSGKTRDMVEQQLANQKVSGVTPALIDTIMTFSLVTAIGVAVVAVGCYVVLGIFIRKGMGWARTVGLVLAIVSISRLFGMTMPGGIATIVQVLLGIAAIFLCFTGPAGAFFKARKDFRLASKGR
ncbi:hypothetical protein AAGW05_01390 [Arthrobacter sp. LAPM80]|uniref:hypothetical protein n=1 Tax=Arthrobacter sp. LAPM80 TaxID=3141788 RepID=UPI00398B8537